MSYSRVLALILAVSLGAIESLQAGDWPQWRGPNFNGAAEEQNLPASWSATENLVWKVPLPGAGSATPIIWGDHIFVTSPDAQKNLLLLCFNRKDGRVRWQREVAVGDKSVGRNNAASPSPVTDGRRVFVMFATGDLAAYDFEGRPLWARNLGKDFGKFSIMWIYGSSPMLHEGKLYVQVLQRNPPPPDYPFTDDRPERESYLLCLDPQTGKDLWRHVRSTDSTKESQEAYSTPIPYRGRNGNEILVVGGDHASGHDPGNGREMWRLRLYDKRDDWYRIVTSPVAADGLIYAAGPKGQPVVAIKDGGSGTLTEAAVAWRFREAPTDWSTPLLYRGKLYVLDGGKRILSCLDPKTGARLWHGELGVPDPIWSSPTGADGKIYLLSEKGTALVVAAGGDEFKLLSRIALDETPCKASVAAAQGQLFLRTAQHLFCVGRK
jgi:outer membrane protein assembly factor BamB